MGGNQPGLKAILGFRDTDVAESGSLSRILVLYYREFIMGSIFVTTLFSLLSGVPGMFGDYFKKKQEMEQLKLQTDMQIEVERQKLAGQLAQAETDRAKAALLATSSTFKYVAFVVWFGPYIVGLIAPKWSAAIFSNLAAMPEWYVQSVVLIMFTIWGISTGAPVVSSIFSGMQDFFQARRDYKVEKAKVDRKAFYEGIRAAKGMVTDADVKKYEPVLDKLDSNE